mmetsp:Transcript_17979/g.25352  ORF Transcript_17979/g.25352 Transcript_17979/m.25352 type:complete len:224 (-) Transcript_17979:6544-7215(-)
MTDAIIPAPPAPSSPAEHSPLLQAELNRCEMELHAARMIYGDDHPKLAETLTTLGLLHQHMLRNHDKALMYHCEALRILSKESPKEEHDRVIAMAVALTDVAQIHEARSDNERALYTYREALGLLRSINLAESDPRIFSAKQGIDRLCRCSSTTREECTCYQHPPDEVKEDLKIKGDWTSGELLLLGEEAMTDHKYEEASKYYRQAASVKPEIAITYYKYFAT